MGVGDGQGGLACCDSWGRKELDMTEQMNWTELNWTELNDGISITADSTELIFIDHTNFNCKETEKEKEIKRYFFSSVLNIRINVH